LPFCNELYNTKWQKTGGVANFIDCLIMASQ